MRELRPRDVLVICVLAMCAFGVIDVYTWCRITSIIILVLMVLGDYMEENA